MYEGTTLTARSIIAQAQTILRDGGYEVAMDSYAADKLGDLCFMAEDPFGVVLVVAYETWSALSDEWNSAQAVLVKALTEKLHKGNPKAWEGYLVLLTPSPSGDERAEDEIRYDTSRVRKIVGTGESIRFIADLSDVLMPLLPLSPDGVGSDATAGSILDNLPSMLVARNVPQAVALAVVRAFKEDEPLLEQIAEALRA